MSATGPGCLVVMCDGVEVARGHAFSHDDGLRCAVLAWAEAERRLVAAARLVNLADNAGAQERSGEQLRGASAFFQSAEDELRRRARMLPQ